MKIEILTTNGIKSAFRELNIKAARTYKSTETPHFEVWEIEKFDLHKLEEVNKWPKGWGLWAYGKGSGYGTACDFFTINGQFLIGWGSNTGNNTYDKLSDYLCSGLGKSSFEEICALASDLARTNGLSLAKLFKTYEG